MFFQFSLREMDVKCYEHVIVPFHQYNYTIFNIIGDRARLSGMHITGTSSQDDSETQLYQDTSTIKACFTYPESGTSVCSDVITLPVGITERVRYVNISVLNWLMLCEVQVFAGMYVLMM